MANSFSLASMTSHALILILLIHRSSLFNNSLAAKHSHKNRGHHASSHRPGGSNPRLHQAFIALQAWKRAIQSDPNNFTTNWVGPSVCDYTGVYCARSLEENKTRVVAGIDLNHGDIAGPLPEELGLLTDLALIHLNSNRFCGVLPSTFTNLSLLYELDLSNNRFVGPFPTVVLSLPMLKYLDIRFNNFEGAVPPQLFARKIDAVFLNNNRFTNFNIPSSTSGSSATVLVFANNNYGGCLPPGIVNFANTLEELLLINTNLSGCLPEEVGFLYKLKVFDVSFNKLAGPIPYSMAGLYHLEQLNLGHNMLTGGVPDGVCMLPNISNFTVSYNFFCEEGGVCTNLTSKKGVNFDDRRNCLPERRLQRTERECKAVLDRPVECVECIKQGGGGGGGFGGGAVPPAVAAVPLPSPPSLAPMHT